MGEQGLTKRPVAQKIEELLSLHQVRRDPRERLPDFRRQIAREHVPEVGLGHVAQVVSRGTLDEFVEIEWLVHPLRVGWVELALPLLPVPAAILAAPCAPR